MSDDNSDKKPDGDLADADGVFTSDSGEPIAEAERIELGDGEDATERGSENDS
jgi:hypothetical protein